MATADGMPRRTTLARNTSSIVDPKRRGACDPAINSPVKLRRVSSDMVGSVPTDTTMSVALTGDNNQTARRRHGGGGRFSEGTGDLCGEWPALLIRQTGCPPAHSQQEALAVGEASRLPLQPW